MYTGAIADPTWVQSGSVQPGPYTHVYPRHALLSPPSSMKFAFTTAVITDNVTRSLLQVEQ